MPEPDCFLCCRISHAMRNFTSGKIWRIRIGHCSEAWFLNGFTAHLCSDAWFYHGFIHWGSEPSKHCCRRYMRSTECPSSFLGISLRLMLGSKFGLKLKICQKMKCFFFVWTRGLFSRNFVLSSRSAVSWDQSLDRAIAGSRDNLNSLGGNSACTRSVIPSEIKFWWMKLSNRLLHE